MNRYDRHEAERARKNYRQDVHCVARGVVEEFLADDVSDIDQLVTEAIQNHPRIVDTPADTLVFSNHPSAAIVNGTGPESRDLGHSPGHSFPFDVFAFDAFEMDVADEVRSILKKRVGDIDAIID